MTNVQGKFFLINEKMNGQFVYVQSELQKSFPTNYFMMVCYYYFVTF